MAELSDSLAYRVLVAQVPVSVPPGPRVVCWEQGLLALPVCQTYGCGPHPEAERLLLRAVEAEVRSSHRWVGTSPGRTLRPALQPQPGPAWPSLPAWTRVQEPPGTGRALGCRLGEESTRP